MEPSCTPSSSKSVLGMRVSLYVPPGFDCFLPTFGMLGKAINLSNAMDFPFPGGSGVDTFTTQRDLEGCGLVGAASSAADVRATMNRTRFMGSPLRQQHSPSRSQ